MAEDKRINGMNEQVYERDKILHISSASIYNASTNPTGRLSAQAGVVYIRPYERTILTSTATASGNITLYLPESAECLGSIIYIKATIANSTTVTIKDRAGTSLFEALDTDGDYICIMSTGVGWVDLSVDGIA